MNSDIAWAVVSIVGIAAVVVIKLGKMFLASRGNRELADTVAQLDTHVADLRRQLAEVEERLDFTERLLAQSREANKLAGP